MRASKTSFFSWNLFTARGFPVSHAHSSRVTAASPKRRPAEVKIPSPVKLIFIAAALAPNRMQRNTVNSEAPNGRPWLVKVGDSVLLSVFINRWAGPLHLGHFGQRSISCPNSITSASFPVASRRVLNSFGSASITGKVL